MTECEMCKFNGMGSCERCVRNPLNKDSKKKMFDNFKLEYNLFCACMMAKNFQKSGTPADIAIARSAKYYGYSKTDVARARNALKLSYK